MYNCNGTLITTLGEADTALTHSLHSAFSIHEIIRLYNGRFLFWESHYFRMIASLRRYRFAIPMQYTMEFFQNEFEKLVKAKQISENGLLQIQFLQCKGETQFIISLERSSSFGVQIGSYAVDLYKEASITSGDLSNLSPTNMGLRLMANRYAEENGLEDVLLLNEQKNLVEALRGTLYLLQGDQLVTPNLQAGCQDFVLRTAFHNWLQGEQSTYTLAENKLNPFELQKADEVMILSLEKGFISVSEYRKTKYGQEQIKELYSLFGKVFS